MLVGPTGGFIIAFIITAWLVGYLTERDLEASYLKNLMYMCVGMLVCYAIGLIGFKLSISVLSAKAHELGQCHTFSSCSHFFHLI